MKHFSTFSIFLFFAVSSMFLGGCEWPDKGHLVINEICGKDQHDMEWIEVGNTSKNPINLKGYKLRKMTEEGLDKKIYEFPDVWIGPGEIYTINTEDLKVHIPHKKTVIVELEDPNEKIVDEFDSEDDLGVENHPIGGSYARIPNLTGEWFLCATASYKTPNTSSQTDGIDNYDDGL